MTELLKPDVVARRLKVGREMLRLMRKFGKGPPWIQISPKIIRYDEDELIAWIKEHKSGSLQAGQGVVAKVPVPGARGSRLYGVSQPKGCA